MKTLQKGIVTILLLLITQVSFAQVKISGEYRINPVYADGFRALQYEGDKPGFYTMQRTRLNLSYTLPKNIKAEVIVQDRRFWGDEDIVGGSAPNLDIFRAYVEKYFTPSISLKLGRQSLMYDNERVFGYRNWGGTLAHDAAKFKYETEKGFKFHLVGAWNSEGETLRNAEYERKFYKSLAFVWLHKDFGDLKLSMTAGDMGKQIAGGTDIAHQQILGGYLKWNIAPNLRFEANYYHQLGKHIEGEEVKDINAYGYFAELQYKMNDAWKFSLGVDAGSGTNGNEVNQNTVNTYQPWFALKHAYFGFMDLLYVKNTPVSGASDYYLKLNWKPNNKLSIDNHIHTFMANADVFDSTDNDSSTQLGALLGVENDFQVTYKMDKNFKASLGYAAMSSTSTLDAQFGGEESSGFNQLIYAVITANIDFYKSK